MKAQKACRLRDPLKLKTNHHFVRNHLNCIAQWISVSILDITQHYKIFRLGYLDLSNYRTGTQFFFLQRTIDPEISIGWPQHRLPTHHTTPNLKHNSSHIMSGFSQKNLTSFSLNNKFSPTTFHENLYKILA